jgi:hypothetical protein
VSGREVRATFWAQVEPRWWFWNTTTDLRSVSVRKVTQRKPRSPVPGCVLVKLTVKLPEEAFVPRVMEGEVTVPPGSWEQVPATVTAEDLDGPGG